MFKVFLRNLPTNNVLYKPTNDTIKTFITRSQCHLSLAIVNQNQGPNQTSIGHKNRSSYLRSVRSQTRVEKEYYILVDTLKRIRLHIHLICYMVRHDKTKVESKIVI